MAKRSNMSQLLHETDPSNLKNIAIGSALGVFVFAGAYLFADSAMFLAYGDSDLTANVISVDTSWMENLGF